VRAAIASSGPTLDSAVDGRFGRCRCFVVVDTETLDYTVIENAAASRGSGAGIMAAQLVANSGAEAVVAGNLGPNAYQALSASGMALYQAWGGTVRDVAQALQRGELTPFGGASVAAHAGMAASPPPPPGDSDSLEQLRQRVNGLTADLKSAQAKLDRLQGQAPGASEGDR